MAYRMWELRDLLNHWPEQTEVTIWDEHGVRNLYLTGRMKPVSYRTDHPEEGIIALQAVRDRESPEEETERRWWDIWEGAVEAMEEMLPRLPVHEEFFDRFAQLMAEMANRKKELTAELHEYPGISIEDFYGKGDDPV